MFQCSDQEKLRKLESFYDLPKNDFLIFFINTCFNIYNKANDGVPVWAYQDKVIKMEFQSPKLSL